ncbi:glycoside hydrolase family 3 protein [Bipolaris sorokiniana ND90Pr]|uniref:beta-glucosidase n=1 Tax=Cochliobolus sativus (strain ND90Pr / ATCC 201652) TaxID=665912 RepID=M2SZ08_COCSN|nr:glycoside hydrolase family 3 protein [Bipolaris sorokiniana ND90Pr]EMD62022.1 glycoside hydrolase family 3 protein [Bipolaris sorokiniana ND90Pr]
MSSKVETILQSLTLEEKITLLAGKDFWETVPIPEKGVPAIKTSDGPNGARGGVFTGGTRAACFPAAVCTAATWDPANGKRIGHALAEEIKTKSARVLLAPTMCNHRHPLGGRNFESFSEDPYLAGKMAANVVNGLQEKGIAATIKHFAANEQETDRLRVNEIVSERALREIYMKPFEITVKEANPLAVMTSYNKVNGTHADSNEFLLKQVLRGEWGWNGLVMSDWGGTNSTADSLNAGLDLEMPGPTRWRSVEAVTEAVKKGEVTEATITERTRNVLNLIEKVGAFENPEIPPERSVVDPKHCRLIRDVAGQGITLLKNNGVLPLRKQQVKGKKIGLFGLAKEALIHGGGSASLNAHYRITPEEGLKSAYGDDVEFKFAKGAATYRLIPPLSKGCRDMEGNDGWTMKLFDKDNKSKPIKTAHRAKEAAFSPLLEHQAKHSEVVFGATFYPTESGSHYLGCSGIGPTTVYINEELVFEQKHNSPDAMGFLFGGNPEKEFRVPFTKGQCYKIEIISRPPSGSNDDAGILDGLPGFRLGFMYEEEHDKDLAAEAQDLAKDCDYAIVFTGHTPVWETEGQDQASFHLPREGTQDKLIAAVSSVNPKTIVVNSTGVPVALPWLDNVAALVQAWFPGQEAGNAIADILSGAVNPSGHLPISWPKRIEDAPAHGNFPGERDESGQLTVKYAEGVFVGYRHYDRLGKEKVHFPFGFGLSYTAFAISNAAVAKLSSGAFNASASVTNTGSVAGAVVVQLYVGRKERSDEHPVKTLAAFHKVDLLPGEETAVLLPFANRDFAYFDEEAKEWVVEKGLYEFSFAQSAGHVDEVIEVEVEGVRGLKI